MTEQNCLKVSLNGRLTDNEETKIRAINGVRMITGYPEDRERWINLDDLSQRDTIKGAVEQLLGGKLVVVE